MTIKSLLLLAKIGLIWSVLVHPSTGRTDDSDPVTQLTSSDRYLVESSYEKLRSAIAFLNSLIAKMGVIWSALVRPNTGKTDDPDPVTGLTSRDRYLVKSSYEQVRKNPLESGIALLNIFFKKHPEALQLFPFRDVPFEELPSNSRYKAHCNAVIYGFSAIVDALDNTDLLVPILTKVGEAHVPRKVTDTLFLQMKDSIIELFSTFMKTEEIDAWKKTLKVAFDVINKSLNEARAAVK